MAYDFKREFRDLYQPKTAPMLVDVPAMTFAVVAGAGDPNEEEGSYRRALELLYAFSYTVKMSKMGAWQPEGYFDYVVPPLEGLWWGGEHAFDGTGIVDKTGLSWVSLIRQPDFVCPDILPRISEMAAEKKPALVDAIESGELRLVRFSEGRCAQSMHRGPYDEEGTTVSKLAAFVDGQGLRLDIGEVGSSRPADILCGLDRDGGVPSIRLHHEIYLGDPRRTKPGNLRTVIRHPVA